MSPSKSTDAPEDYTLAQQMTSSQDHSQPRHSSIFHLDQSQHIQQFNQGADGSEMQPMPSHFANGSMISQPDQGSQTFHTMNQSVPRQSMARRQAAPYNTMPGVNGVQNQMSQSFANCQMAQMPGNTEYTRLLPAQYQAVPGMAQNSRLNPYLSVQHSAASLSMNNLPQGTSQQGSRMAHVPVPHTMLMSQQPVYFDPNSRSRQMQTSSVQSLEPSNGCTQFTHSVYQQPTGRMLQNIPQQVPQQGLHMMHRGYQNPDRSQNISRNHGQHGQHGQHNYPSYSGPIRRMVSHDRLAVEPWYAQTSGMQQMCSNQNPNTNLNGSLVDGQHEMIRNKRPVIDRNAYLLQNSAWLSNITQPTYMPPPLQQQQRRPQQQHAVYTTMSPVAQSKAESISPKVFEECALNAARNAISERQRPTNANQSPASMALHPAMNPQKVPTVSPRKRQNPILKSLQDMEPFDWDQETRMAPTSEKGSSKPRPAKRVKATINIKQELTPSSSPPPTSHPTSGTAIADTSTQPQPQPQPGPPLEPDISSTSQQKTNADGKADVETEVDAAAVAALTTATTVPDHAATSTDLGTNTTDTQEALPLEATTENMPAFFDNMFPALSQNNQADQDFAILFSDASNHMSGQSDNDSLDYLFEEDPFANWDPNQS